ncbi:MAG: phosphatidylserine decarboxylase family protein [Microbacter sp.]
MKIHREGRWILSSLLFILLLINIIIYFSFSKVFLEINILISILTIMFFTYFFRNPSRAGNIDDPSLIIAPADGTVVVIEPTMENEYFHDKRIQVSIFMSIFNIHANWYPIAGTVKYVKHHNGKHFAAYRPKSSRENERCSVVIETPLKTQILVRQIAGVLARRIVTYAAPQKSCHLNEHLGFIKFGSRVDLFLPMDTEIYVTHGEKTVGNETIIARLNE